MRRRHLVYTFAGLFALAAGYLVGPALAQMGKPPVEYTGRGNPVDPSQTLEELTASADVIVQARLVHRRNRIHREVLPVYAEDAVTVIGQQAVETPFTDSVFQVVDTLKGPKRHNLVIMQSGGTVRRTGLGRGATFGLVDDPLFLDGSEHMLFLHDITNDGVNSKGRKLFRTVNPRGRFEVLPGGALLEPPVVTNGEEMGEVARLRTPVTADELKQQVRGILAAG